MKKISLLLLLIITSLSLTACGKPKVDSTNTLSPAELTPREEMLSSGQDLFLYNYEVDSTYKSITLAIEVYKNGVKGDDIANFRYALPTKEKKEGNTKGTLAVILGSDHRFTASICDEGGNVLISSASDVVQPLEDLNYHNQKPQITALTPIDGKMQTLAYLAYGDEAKTQGTFEEGVFLNPTENIEQAAAFDRIYLLKCTFS